MCFAYDDPTAPILRDATLKIRGGTKVGIGGPSGAGKTTLIDLVLRHFDPDQGRILLDGVDLKDMDLKALRRQVVVVEQDTSIIAGTVTENIAYGCPTASETQIIELPAAPKFIMTSSLWKMVTRPSFAPAAILFPAANDRELPSPAPYFKIRWF